MDLLVSGYKEIETGVRFSVTILAEDGEPEITIDGWLINRERRVSPPKSRVKFSKWPIKFVTVSKRLEDKIREAVLSNEGVVNVLGPEPPLNFEPKTIPGESKVSL